MRADSQLELRRALVNNRRELPLIAWHIIINIIIENNRLTARRPYRELKALQRYLACKYEQHQMLWPKRLVAKGDVNDARGLVAGVCIRDVGDGIEIYQAVSAHRH